MMFSADGATVIISCQHLHHEFTADIRAKTSQHFLCPFPFKSAIDYFPLPFLSVSISQLLLTHAMDTLPPEIISQIITNIPKSSLPEIRLVCHSFNTFAFPPLFSHVPHWFDYTLSHRAVTSLVNDVFNRPSVMWSPWATGPDGPAESVWLAICWKVLVKSELPRGDVLTAENFAELSGNEEMCENRLRTGQNRFLLHRVYSDKCDWNATLL